MNSDNIYQKDIENSLSILKKGGTIIYPTDTIWGLGCDATNEKAISKIYKMKLRHHSKSMIILLDNIEHLSNYVKSIPEVANSLLSSVTSPMTLIYPEAKNLPKNCIADDGSIAIRITNDKFCKELISKLRKPLISTSANVSGYETPIFYKEIKNEIIDKVDYVCEHGRFEVRHVKPSTLIKIINEFEYEILRQ